MSSRSLILVAVVLGSAMLPLHFAQAGDDPYLISFLPTYLTYSSSGDYHASETLADEGFSADFSYPIGKGFRAKAVSIIGLATGFEYFGGGLDYEFSSAKVEHQLEGDSIDIFSYRKWRPYIDVTIGYSSVQTEISAGPVHTAVSEDVLLGVGRAGVGYALSQTWELNFSAMFFYGASPNVSIMGYGIAAGVSANLF